MKKGTYSRTRLDESTYTAEDRGYKTPCWIAKTRKHSRGYPTIRISGVERRASRAMYEQEIGPIPAGHQIDHLCRVTYCVRPDHLEAVTPAENTQRGRSAKLNAEQVRRARTGGENARMLAAEFGVTEFLIYQIRQGRIWKGV